MKQATMMAVVVDRRGVIVRPGAVLRLGPRAAHGIARALARPEVRARLAELARCAGAAVFGAAWAAALVWLA